MLNHISIPILLTCLLFTGCSSTPQKKKSIISEEQQTELSDIFDRHLTDDDWDKYQQEWEGVENLVNYDSDIDLRKDYSKDPMILMSIMQMSSDKPTLQKELTNFINKLMLDSMTEESGNGDLEILFK